ncbi:MAG: transporter [Deltaproteobacteria bacterium]|nr:transporter [Deltaproteobacteria bacterium]
MRFRHVLAPTLLLAFVAFDAHASGWTVGEGQLIVKESFGYWSSDRKFASTIDEQLLFPMRTPSSPARGDRIPFDPVTAGRFTIFGATTSVSYGVLPWLDLSASLPVLRVDFDTASRAGDPQAAGDVVDARVGLGDLLAGVKLRVARGTGWVGAIKMEAKIPTGRFDPNAWQTPITEGQTDLSGMTQVGVSLGRFGYAGASAGYKLRLRKASNQFAPGDEVVLAAELGANLPYRLMVKAAADALLGQPGTIGFADSEWPRRRLFSLWGGVVWKATPNTSMDASLRWLIAGENFPTGLPLFVGVTHAFDLRPSPQRERQLPR